MIETFLPASAARELTNQSQAAVDKVLLEIQEKIKAAAELGNRTIDFHFPTSITPHTANRHRQDSPALAKIFLFLQKQGYGCNVCTDKYQTRASDEVLYFSYLKVSW